jgi:recombination protein RecA
MAKLVMEAEPPKQPLVPKSTPSVALPPPKTANDREARRAAIKTAFEQIEKAHGKGSVMRMSDKPLVDIAVIPTTSISLDLALGVGGVPRGRVVEIFGPEASGKTTICLHLAAQVQAAGGTVAFIDAEHALDMKYAQALGVRPDELYLSQPECGEQALEIAEAWVRSAAIDLVLVDSVAALTPRAEIEGEMGDPQMGLQARLMSQALRKLTAPVASTGTTLMFTNQLRQKIGVMFGNPETTTGGNALKFYASVRLDIRRIETLKNGSDMIGNRSRIKVVKNKVAPPFKECIVDIMYGKGIDAVGDIVNTAVQFGLIDKSGSWYSYKEERIGQGMDAVKVYFATKPELIGVLRDGILAKSRETA